MLRYGKLRFNEPLTTSSGYVCSDLVADHRVFVLVLIISAQRREALWTGKGNDRLTFAVLRFEPAASPRHGGAQLPATCCVASCK